MTAASVTAFFAFAFLSGQAPVRTGWGWGAGGGVPSRRGRIRKKAEMLDVLRAGGARPPAAAIPAAAQGRPREAAAPVWPSEAAAGHGHERSASRGGARAATQGSPRNRVLHPARNLFLSLDRRMWGRHPYSTRPPTAQRYAAVDPGSWVSNRARRPPAPQPRARSGHVSVSFSFA